ncbi:hypothetical protein BgiMline_024318, partial [Biomphalaria glabrata]
MLLETSLFDTASADQRKTRISSACRSLWGESGEGTFHRRTEEFVGSLCFSFTTQPGLNRGTQ